MSVTTFVFLFFYPLGGSALWTGPGLRIPFWRSSPVIGTSRTRTRTRIRTPGRTCGRPAGPVVRGPCGWKSARGRRESPTARRWCSATPRAMTRATTAASTKTSGPSLMAQPPSASTCLSGVSHSCLEGRGQFVCFSYEPHLTVTQGHWSNL